MNLATRTAAALALSLVFGTSGCGKKSPEPKQPEAAAPAQTPETEAPAQQPPAGPEIIDQAGGEQVSPIDNPLIDAGDDIDTDTGENGEPEQPTDSPVASLPGFSPAPSTPPSAAALAANAGTDQVLVQVSVFELTPKLPEDLAPIQQFLSGDLKSLSVDEAAAFMEMVAALKTSGVMSTLSSPRVLVASGQQATIEVTQLGGGQTGGVPTARSALLFSTAPTVRRTGGEDDPATVDMNYELKFAEADSAFQVVAQDLGLAIGPRASGRGTISLEDQRTFFFVRKVVGEDSSRELLVLVRPQVVKADFTK